MRVLWLMLILAAMPVTVRADGLFQIVIQRNMSCNNGEVAGSLSIDGREIARTLELPWRNNENNISRVPAGTYPATVRTDGPLRWRIELAPSAGRENIQIHIGNYPRQTKGCVLIGTDVTASGGTCALSNSTAGMERLRDAMAKASDTGVSTTPVTIEVVIVD